jgi:uncharacterized protein (DUF924 family)
MTEDDAGGQAAADIEDVLEFWFETLSREQWYRADPVVDAQVGRRLGGLYDRLARAVPEAWLATPEGCLAAVVVLDQVPRNLFRGSPRAFATDAQARAIAAAALKRGFERALAPRRREVLYLPFQHAEDLGCQDRAVALYAALGDERALDFARRHRDIIARFGRFPHRNEALGRTSSAEEVAFLAQPGSSF